MLVVTDRVEPATSIDVDVTLLSVRHDATVPSLAKVADDLSLEGMRKVHSVTVAV